MTGVIESSKSITLVVRDTREVKSQWEVKWWVYQTRGGLNNWWVKQLWNKFWFEPLYRLFDPGAGPTYGKMPA